MYFNLEETVGNSPSSAGYSLIYKFQFCQEDVNEFAKITGDDNPIHINNEYAKGTLFKQTIVHGFFVGSIFSRIFGTDYPGTGTIYLSQDMKFLKPVYVNASYYAKIYVEDINNINGKATIITTIFNENMEDVFIGKAKLISDVYKTATT